MNNNMITEKDIKILKTYETPLGRITNWAVILFPFILGVGIFFNLYLASRIGNNAGYDLIHLTQTWVQGVEINNQYSGMFLAAIQRLETAILQLSFTVIFAILAYAYHKRRRMDLRILETLKNNGLL